MLKENARSATKRPIGLFRFLIAGLIGAVAINSLPLHGWPVSALNGCGNGTEYTHMKNNSPIADRTLWDSLGNYCRVTMYRIGSNTFEVYFHDFNDAIPGRYVDELGTCNNKVDHWLRAKKAAGFVEQLPSYNPAIKV